MQRICSENSKAKCNRKAAFLLCIRTVKIFEEPARYGGELRPPGADHSYSEMASADPRHVIRPAESAFQDACHLPQGRVAFLVAIGAVDAFEIHEIDMDHEQFFLESGRSKLLVLGGDKKTSSVMKPCEIIREEKTRVALRLPSFAGYRDASTSWTTGACDFALYDAGGYCRFGHLKFPFFFSEAPV